MPLVSTFGNLSARAFGLGAAAKVFSPLSLFAAGEQGVWYDPSDLTTMFEDSAGTTPVHTPGNGVADSPVGLLLDKHSNGVGTNGAARYNLLTYSEQFDNAAWSKFGTGAVTANQATAPDGTSTADKLQISSSNGGTYQQFTDSTYSGVTMVASICAKKATQSDYGHFCIYAQVSTTVRRYAILVNLTNGAFVSAQNSAAAQFSSTSYSITDLGSGWYRISLTAAFPTGTFTNYGMFAEPANATNTYNTDLLDITNNTSGNNLYIWGADFRRNSQVATSPTYQPITSSWAATMAGNHATQSTSTARPTLSARYNLLTYSEQFDNAVWTTYNSATKGTPNTITAPDGTLTADPISIAGIADSQIYQSYSSLPISGTLVFSVYVKRNAASDQTFRLRIFTNAFPNYSSNFTATANWQQFSFSVASATSGNVSVMVDSSNNAANLAVWGADLRYSNEGAGLPPYQRISDANTYDSTGFPYYIKTDGVDDFMVNSSVNFSGTNKMGGFAAVRKFATSSAICCVYELTADSAANNGGFATFAPNTTSLYDVRSRGTASQIASTTSATYAAPVSNVVSGIGDISAPSITLRINGSQISINTSSQGTGNYASSALNLFRRNGAQYALSGRTYGIIIRGASSTSTEIANTESWLNTKAKIY